MRYLLSFLFFSMFIYGFNYHLKPYKISEGVYCFFGLPSEVNNINGGNMINSCYVKTSEGYVVIDSGPTYSYAQEAYESMSKVEKLPIRYVINTSSDEVHVLGNEFYQEMGATLIGPKGYKENLELKKELFLSKKLNSNVMINTRVVPLDEYVEEKKLVVSDMKVLIKALENDENHLYVYIEEKEILFAGDLIFNNRIVPINNGRSIISWLKSLNEIKALKWVDIISSHGYMTRRSALEYTEKYLTELKEEVEEHIHAEKSLEQTLLSMTMKEFRNKKFYSNWHTRNVQTVYDELQDIYDFEDEIIVAEPIEEQKVIKQEVTLDQPILNLVKKTEDKKIATIPKAKVERKVSLHYRSFDDAMNIAKKRDKIVLIKVRSTICKYCDQLDRIMERNKKVKSLLNRYFELVRLNVDYQSVPLDLYISSTPTLIFIRPDNSEVLMQLTGIRALGELLDVLNEAVDDGHKGAYLRK